MGTTNSNILSLRSMTRGGLDLHDPDTDGERKEREPFDGRDAFAEEEDGEEGGGEDLHLVGDLEGGGVEVGGGDILEVVLDDCVRESVQHVCSSPVADRT